MLSSHDPFIQMIRQMCTKDKVVQSLYQGTISWSDVPSDDEVLELDDWKAYLKIEARAKQAYQHHLTAHKKVYTIPQRTKIKKQCNQNVSRIPYVALKQRLEPVVTKEIIEEIVHQPPIEYEEMDSIHSSELVSTLIPEIVPTERAPTLIPEIVPTERAPTLIPEIVPTEHAPKKMLEVNINLCEPIHTSSFSSFYRYVFLSVIIILVYRLITRV